ncbi:hypothetical protein [Tessaracoccus sp.]
MCKSASEGGQRCVGHAAATLVAAEAKYDALAHTAKTAMDAGRPLPAGVHAKGLKAAFDLDDARARYASTPQGEADLTARMDRLTVNGKAPNAFGPDGETYSNYAEAITEGRRLRERSKAANEMVKSGIMTGKEAKADTKFPSEYATQRRTSQIKSAKLDDRNATTLAAAEAKHQPLLEAARALNNAGTPIPSDLAVRGLTAEYALADARATYATTPRGERNLTSRMKALKVNGKAPSQFTRNGEPSEYHQYAEAITDGRDRRRRATSTREAVKAGTMTEQEAAATNQYPSLIALSYREGKLNQAKNR